MAVAVAVAATVTAGQLRELLAHQRALAVAQQVQQVLVTEQLPVVAVVRKSQVVLQERVVVWLEVH